LALIDPEHIQADLELENHGDLPPGKYHYDGFAVTCTKLR
jgi:hypothetical protein